jgi:hypothetical protein
VVCVGREAATSIDFKMIVPRDYLHYDANRGGERRREAG